MRTVEVNVYKLHELSEEAKAIALNQQAEFLACLDWWESVYYDASLFDISITSFDLDSSCIELDLKSNPFDVCTKIITDLEGSICAPYMTAWQWLADLDKLNNDYADQLSKGSTEEFDNDFEDLEASLTDLLGECYLQILSNELKYINSPEYIIESIEANEFEFLVDGSIYTPLN